MKRYPLLSMLLIVFFFALLIITIIWLRPEKEEKKKEIVPETKISVQEKKAQFKATIIPAVNEVYSDLMAQYQEVSESLQASDNNEINDIYAELRKEYRAENNEELLIALKPHPQSIAIAQAAMESSWATSRFYKEANNIYGVWSFNKNDARLAAGETRGDKTIWLKKYDSVEASIRDYYRTLARGGAYKEFRTLKMETDDPYELVKKLDRYSEKGAAYGEELAAIIRFNKFDAYDQQQSPEIVKQPTIIYDPVGQ